MHHHDSGPSTLEGERARDLAMTRTWGDGDRPLTEQEAQEAADTLAALRRTIQNELNQQGED